MLPIIPRTGRTSFMRGLMWLLQNGGNGSLVHLFSNNLPVNEYTELADFTEIANPSLLGMPLPIAIDHGIDITGRDNWEFSTINFMATLPPVPVVAYGYWVDWIDPLTDTRELLWFQKWDVPFSWLQLGQNYPLNLSLGGNQC